MKKDEMSYVKLLREMKKQTTRTTGGETKQWKTPRDKRKKNRRKRCRGMRKMK